MTELPVQVDASWLEHVNSAGMGQTQHRAFPSDSIQASHATSTIPHLPSQTPTVPDPCEVQGYLASHDLVCATFEMYKEFPPRADKIADQFEIFRNNVLYEASTRRTLDYENLSRSGVSLHMLHEWTQSQSRDHPGHAVSSNSVSNNPPIPVSRPTYKLHPFGFGPQPSTRIAMATASGRKRFREEDDWIDLEAASSNPSEDEPAARKRRTALPHPGA